MFDMTDLPIAIDIVDECFINLDFGHATITRIKDAARSRNVYDTPLEMELIHAAGHRLHRATGAKPGCELGQRDLDRNLRWPRPVAQTPQDALRLWQEMAISTSSQAAIARFEDLLFVKRQGNGLDRVRRSTAAYLAALDMTETTDMQTVTVLLRVWSLARAVGEPDLDEEVRRRMADIANEVMASSPGERPGVSIPVLEALAVGPIRDTGDPHDIDGILARAAAIHSRGYLATQIAAIRRGRAGGDRATLLQIAHDELAAYFADADSATEPAVRMFRLKDAATVATHRGLPDLARRATSLMQKIKRSDLGLQQIQIDLSLRPFVAESYFAPFTQGESWHYGLAYFFTTGPPTGPIDQIREIGNSSEGVLSSLFPTTILGPDGLPRASTQSEEDVLAQRMNQAASISAQRSGPMLAEGLNRMSEVYGVPSVDDLTSVIVAQGCRDPLLGRGLAKGLRFFWDGDYEAAVAVTVPKLESAARALLLELDEGIYRVQLSKDPGGYVGLFVLLEELEELALDPSWAYFLRWFMLGPYGMNVRNEVAHGLLLDPGPVVAALTLRAVSVLALVAGPLLTDPNGTEQHQDATPQHSRTEVLDLLAHPTGQPSIIERALALTAERLDRASWRMRALQTRAAVSRRGERRS